MDSLGMLESPETPALSGPYFTVCWVGGPDGFIRLIDQTLLPAQFVCLDCRTVDALWEAIRSLRVRGAPAIGVAAAFGMVLATQKAATRDALDTNFAASGSYLRTSRPTAVNLFWAIERMEYRLAQLAPELGVTQVQAELLREAQAIADEDVRQCQAIGEHGESLISEGDGVLTHCNAGGLATSQYGTALAVMFRAAERGRRFTVFADETRPLLQGARLTAWELQQRSIDTVLICDNMAAQVMREGKIQLVVVGADRIAANGDTANKIGTYGVAVLAAAHGIPFYVAAPSSTFDLSLPTGAGIPIEQRDPREITHGMGKQTAPVGVRVYNPAFDVTPANLISGIVTEFGVIKPVTKELIERTLKTSLTDDPRGIPFSRDFPGNRSPK
jgi:methylthioribose-1-phosphate isomerase